MCDSFQDVDLKVAIIPDSSVIILRGRGVNPGGKNTYPPLCGGKVKCYMVSLQPPFPNTSKNITVVR